VLAKGFNDKFALMQPTSAESQISFLQVSPAVVGLAEPATSGAFWA